MVNFGAGLQGFINAYPAIQQAQQERQMNEMKLQQTRLQMQQQAAARQAYQDALGKVAQAQGQGPGGTLSLQQMAAMSGGNPDVMQGLADMSKPYINPFASLQRADLTGQYGLQRTQMQTEAAGQREQSREEAASSREQSREKAAKDVAQLRSTTAEEIASKKGSSGQAGQFRLSNDPKYQTLKNEFEANKQFALSVLNTFGPDNPKYKQAKKDFDDAKSALEKYTPEETGSTASIPQEAIQHLKEGEVTTFQNGQKWTLQDGKPVQVE